MLAHDNPPRYGAYLLRYWQVRSDLPGQPSIWRFALQRAGLGKRRVFRDLDALCAYLARELAQQDGSATGVAEQMEMDE